jgi:branched-chain amino acid transport system ATP-binding protein
VRTMLELSELSSGYASVPAVRGISLSVAPEEVVALLGPNGAGKTTTLLTAAGVLRPIGGDVIFEGRSIRRLPVHQIARLGLALVPEERGLFRQLTVKENLRLVRPRGQARPRRDMLSLFPALEGLLSRRVGVLSGGEQQMLALAKALLARPKLLMVDELSHGLAPAIVEQLFPALRRLARDEGMAILLVEQHVDTALAFSDRVYVLGRGQVTLAGSAGELRERRDLFEAGYLGAATGSDGKPPR